jgi:trigger factor
MQVTVENIAALERKLTISVPAEEIDNEVLNRLRKLAAKTKIPGFRPGKAPFELVERHYGNSALQEVLVDLVNSSYEEAIAQKNLNPIGQPRIESLPYKSSQPLTYTAIFEIYPDVKIDLSNFEIEKPVVEITPQDIDAALERIRKQKAKKHETTRGAKTSDFLLLDYVGTIDGKPFADGEVRDARIVLGENLLPEFEKPLHGAKAGDTVKTKFTYAKDYMLPDLAGKEVEFTIQVKKVYELELPPLDDAFAKEIGIESGDVAGLRFETQETMQHYLNQTLKKSFYDAMIEKLVEKNPVEIPEGLLNREIERLKKQNQNMPFVDESARHNIAASLLLGELIELFDIKINQQMLRETCKNVAGRDYNNRKQLEQVEFMILKEQALEKLATKINPIEKKFSYEEFLRGHYA